MYSEHPLCHLTSTSSERYQILRLSQADSLENGNNVSRAHLISQNMNIYCSMSCKFFHYFFMTLCTWRQVPRRSLSYPSPPVRQISYPFLSNSPAKNTLVLFYKSVGITGRGGERGAANGIKPCQVLQLSKQFKICAIFRRFLFLVNRRAVSLYFSEHK